MKDNMDNFQNQHWNQNQQNNQQSTQTNQTQQQPNNQVNQQQPSMIMKLMSSCLPVLLEQFTGQTMPMGGNNNPEIQFMLSQVLNTQQQIVNSLQELARRLSNLETRASQQFTGLSQQIQNFKSVRLTHDRERKQIELGTNQDDFDKSQQFNQKGNNYD